jgi:chemotaxis protein MotD
VRSESHFAPVAPTPTLSHPGVSARDSGKHGAGADAKGHQAAAPAVDAPMPSPEEPVSVSLSPAQQIADRIATEAAAFENADRVGAPPDQPSLKPALKVLQIQLQPADLGTVTVRMELKESGLKLHVEVDRTETADIIRSDQDTLSKLLRAAGYGIDPGSIRIVEGDRTVTPSQAGQQGAQTNLQSSSQSQSGWSERQDRPQRGYAGTNGGEAQIPTNRNDTHETTTNRTGRGLYI